MSHEPSTLAILIFLGMVGITLGISFYLGRKAKDSAGYFAAHGQIPWFVNGVAFAGDYLSAASFLGICGMIAFYGYDGFLYSIGYLAGWIVALFVVAEPMKRLGKFTFADALNAKFNSPGIKLAAGVSTLAVSIFYLIPQMVGAGVLVRPLLGWEHWQGVVMVGAVVIVIVVTAGMVSTTWVQFIKGGMLIVFSSVLTVMILQRGLHADPELPAAQAMVKQADGSVLVNGLPKGNEPGEAQLKPVGSISKLPGGVEKTGALGPLEFFSTLEQSEVVLWSKTETKGDDGSTTTTFSPKPTPGSQILQPGASPTFAGIRSEKFSDKLNFLSLMLALFCGTASLPHILIRYYTVKDEAAARKSTIVGIACIGFFYVLTLYMGLGAMTSGALDVTDSNMAAPLLARSMSELLFAIISAIAFTTVLGTVSGLILASAGAVTHDLLESVTTVHMSDQQRVLVAKCAAVVVGVIAIFLGIAFKELNVSYLVGWAFSVAASANLPALVMLLFWRGTTKQGIIAAVLVGMISSLTWILLSGDTYASVYGWDKADSIVPFSQPGIVTIPLGFATLIVVSLITQPKQRLAA
ncbi:cation acetate symporter [Lacipirellula parvula]|uniref:Acetate permease ActP n=1 Tax=Lacipirellula parvula TaxID=2650471 RepID=A0A5K7X1K8_9BACT|nr:cation acetate symporter [Lacipirellula parvula]BBO30528.1 acetate permease ActP [Lacipirellula parvula]